MNMEKLKNSKLLVLCYWASRLAYFMTWLVMALLLIMFILKVAGYGHLSSIKLDLPLNLVGQELIELTEHSIAEAEIEWDTVQLSIPADAIPTSWFAIIAIVMIIWILAYNRLLLSLSLLIKRVRKAEIFTLQNSKAVQQIGLLMIGISLFSGIVMSAYAHSFVQALNNSSIPMQFKASFTLEGLFPGVLVFLLGYIFQYGQELKKEQDLTV